MVVFFRLDNFWIGYLLYVLLIVVFGVTFAPVVAFVIQVIFFTVFWICNFKVKGSTLIGKIISILGVISSFFIGFTISQNIVSIECSFYILGIMISFLLLQKWKEVKNILPYINIIGSVICLIFSLAWTIGYDIDINTKKLYNNTAYYECKKLETYQTDSVFLEKAKNNGKPLNGVVYKTTDSDILNIPDSSIIDHYIKGEKIQPNLKKMPVKHTELLKKVRNGRWYPIISKNGKEGYIPDTNLKTVYYNKSIFVENKKKQFKPTTWYALLPDFITELCEKTYELIPFHAKIYLS